MDALRQSSLPPSVKQAVCFAHDMHTPEGVRTAQLSLGALRLLEEVPEKHALAAVAEFSARRRAASCRAPQVSFATVCQKAWKAHRRQLKTHLMTRAKIAQLQKEAAPPGSSEPPRGEVSGVVRDTIRLLFTRASGLFHARIDVGVRERLGQLEDPVAIEALFEFAFAAMHRRARIRNLSAYLMTIITRHQPAAPSDEEASSSDGGDDQTQVAPVAIAPWPLAGASQQASQQQHVVQQVAQQANQNVARVQALAQNEIAARDRMIRQLQQERAQLMAALEAERAQRAETVQRAQLEAYVRGVMHGANGHRPPPQGAPWRTTQVSTTPVKTNMTVPPPVPPPMPPPPMTMTMAMPHHAVPMHPTPMMPPAAAHHGGGLFVETSKLSALPVSPAFSGLESPGLPLVPPNSSGDDDWDAVAAAWPLQVGGTNSGTSSPPSSAPSWSA